MKILFERLSLVWMFFIPVVANAHSGHGLMGEDHYHAPINLDVLIALAVVVLLVVALKRFLNNKK